jgi:N-acetylglutamate synthase-like GNAT family acetyltransferase
MIIKKLFKKIISKPEIELEIKIRKANHEDVNKIYALGKKINELNFSKQYPFHQRSELKESINDKNSILLVAENKDNVVGFLLAKIIFHRAGGWCILDNIAIEENFRKRGISDMLLKNFYLTLKNKKVNYIQILEEIHQKETHKFWKHQGFKKTKKFIWAEKRIY